MSTVFVVALQSFSIVSLETLSLSAGVFILVTALSLLAWHAARAWRRRRTSVNGVLVLGTSHMAAKVIDEIDSCRDGRFRLIGVVDDTADGPTVRGVTPLLGRLDQLSQIVEVTRPSHIVLAMADRRGRLPESFLLESRLHGVTVEDANDFFERITRKLAIEMLRPSSLILSNQFRHPDLMRQGMRCLLYRAVNVACAAVGLLLATPLMAVLALAIWLDSGRPVFFMQDRVGRGGKAFRLIKFRTMRSNDAPPSEWVSDNADRITRLGKWLRRFRLDELPQLLNVVRGEMNLVGPRPHPVSNHQLFARNIPYYWIRCMVRPGITGWAQVKYGYANDLAEETEKMRYDLYYMKHGNLRFDIRILIETVVLLAFDRRSHQTTAYGQPKENWREPVKAVKAVS